MENRAPIERRARLLAVDDEPVALEIFKGLFEDQYEVATAGNGEQALALVPAFGPDVIVLDAVMPGIDGWETCRRIKKSPATRAIKIVMVSAKATNGESRQQGYEAGADDFVVKPFIHEDLLAKVQVWSELKIAQDNLRSKITELRAIKDQLEEANSRLESALTERTRELLRVEKELELCRAMQGGDPESHFTPE